MIQVFDTDTIIFKVLRGTSGITETISGGIYPGERPDDSVKEDITINTIALLQESVPQTGVTNINIHVSDTIVQIAGQPQSKMNTTRLKEVSGLVLGALRAARVTGLKFVVTNQTILANPEISQHYVNLRINWSIH